ncbi:DUF2062 domain-containing protein [bacterium]|nr:DUF2062 domain-containing protein [bacterium]
MNATLLRAEAPPRLFQRRLITPLKTQIIQGISPRALAWAIAAGIVSGLFPLLVTTTALAIAVGYTAGLNQLVLHTFNWLVYPLQILAIPLFVRVGELVFSAEPITCYGLLLVKCTRADSMQFLRDFGMSGDHGVVAWLITAPLLLLIAVTITRPMLESATYR